MHTPFGPRAFTSSPSSTFFHFSCFHDSLRYHTIRLSLRSCHRDRPPTQRGLVPYVAPDRRKKTLGEESLGAHPWIAAALEAARNPIRVAGLQVEVAPVL